MAVDPVSASLGVATAVTQTIAGISDMAQRRRFEQAFANLSLNEQMKLEAQVAAAKTESDRLAILSNNLVQFLISAQTANQKADTQMYIIAGGLGVVLMIVAVVFAIKS